MHWFWRSAIAVGMGALAFTLLMAVTGSMPGSRYWELGAIFKIFFVALIPCAVTLWLFVVLTRQYGPITNFRGVRARCTNCNAPLTGVDTGICPQCGKMF